MMKIEYKKKQLGLYENIKIRWTKAHAGNMMNDRTDEVGLYLQ